MAVALWRQQFQDRALGWALRLGMVITIAGASTGGLMTRPTDAQLEQIVATRQATIIGAHTVGAPDGGPGLPGTGWSVEHGDLRVPHFIGLHALQVLPVIALLLWRRRIEDRRRARLMVVAGGSYAALFLILIWQALRGQALVSPDALTLQCCGLGGAHRRNGGVALSHANLETGCRCHAELDKSLSSWVAGLHFLRETWLHASTLTSVS